MNKQLINTHPAQWQREVNEQRQPTQRVLQILALPLFMLGALLVLDGLLSASFSALAIGVIGFAAAQALLRHARSESTNQTPPNQKPSPSGD